MRSTDQLTTRQKLFVEILVKNWGQISKFAALKKAGYNSKNDATARVLASKLTNPNLNPHICRYLENSLAVEQEKYEKDKLRRYKTFERLRDGAEAKGQYTGAINSEFRSGQLAGLFVDKKEVTHNYGYYYRNYESRDYTALLIKMLKRKYNLTAVGFHIVKNIRDGIGLYSDDSKLDANKKLLSKGHFVADKSHGYDEFYILNNKKLSIQSNNKNTFNFSFSF